MKAARKDKEPTIRLACRNYDGTSAILRGLLQPAGFLSAAARRSRQPC
jgi:hypothetical protein